MRRGARNKAASFASPALRIQNVSEAAWRRVLSSGRSSDSVALEQRNIMVIGREFPSLDLLHSQYHMYCVCTVEWRVGDCTDADTCRGMLYTSHVSLAWLHFSQCSLSHSNVVLLTQQPVWKQVRSSTCIVNT
jgi:hypothetical protein